MLEAVLYFILGFLAAALIALMVSPAIWNRAVVLTRKRIEASVPLTLNEIQADKDQLRAEFAMSTRRLEMSVDELREKASRQVIEVNRKRDELAKLAEESRERIQTIGELEARASDLRSQLREREERLSVTTQRLEETRTKLEERALELENLRMRVSEAETDADSRRIEMVAKQTVVDSLADKVGDSEQRERAIRMEFAALKEQHNRAMADLERERARNENMATRIARLDGQVGERDEKLSKRERDLARARDTAGSDEAASAEIAHELVQEKARNVELAAKLAKTTLQMEALLSDASNDNVEKAMASMNDDRARLERDLAAVTAERDQLRENVGGHAREKSRDWEVERRENAILRERINDMAAQVTAMTAALEGEGSPINTILAKSSRIDRMPITSISTKAGAKGGNKDDNAQPVTLAERIRALQDSARQGKAR